MKTNTKLLVSPINVEEALRCKEGGADIIDVKNPREGSLGANFPRVIKSIRKRIGSDTILSATLGDVMYKPGTVALAAYGLANCDVDYIKVGLFDFKSSKQAIETLLSVKESVEMVSADIKVVAAGYADFSRVHSLSPSEVIEAGVSGNCDVIMLDTAIKDGKGLFFWLSNDFLQKFVEEVHSSGTLAALAGSLSLPDLNPVCNFGTDIVGVRGIACSSNDRNEGQITIDRVTKLKSIIQG